MVLRKKKGDIMAALTKYTAPQIDNHLKHNTREFTNPDGTPKNPDIYGELTERNKTLHPTDRVPTKEGLTEAQKSKAYYRARMKELYHMKRDNLVCAAEWCCTCPKEITDPAEQERFFDATYRFLNSIYGEKNCIQCVVHYDEGIRNKDHERVLGSPHLHYVFIPVCKVTDTNPEHKQSQFEEKVNAKTVLSKSHLSRFHSQYQSFLDKEGINGKVYTGVTGGKNRTVEELKSVPIEVVVTQKQNERLIEENTSLRSTAIELQEHNRQAVSIINSLKEQIASLKTQTIEHDSSNQQYEQRIQELEAKNQRLTAKANEIIAEKNVEIKTATEQLSAKDSEISGLRQNNQDLQHQVEALQEALKQKEIELAQAQEKVHEQEVENTSREWGHDNAWGSQGNWGKSNNVEVEKTW